MPKTISTTASRLLQTKFSHESDKKDGLSSKIKNISNSPDKIEKSSEILSCNDIRISSAGHAKKSITLTHNGCTDIEKNSTVFHYQGRDERPDRLSTVELREKTLILNKASKPSRFLSPDSITRIQFHARAAPFGLSEEVIQTLTPASPRDNVTGFVDARVDNIKADTVRRAQQHIATSHEVAFYISCDIYNLGGLNSAMNNVAEAANGHYRAMSMILVEELTKTGAKIVPMRTGGDELGVLLVGRVDESSIRTAVQAVSRHIEQYAMDNHLSSIPHPKRPGEKGLGIHMGVAEILPELSLSDIFTQADLEMDRSKNHVRLRV